MAMNSTGPISLAGSTAGQSISLEIGTTATSATTLNDTPVRELAQVYTPATVITMPLDFYGKFLGFMSVWSGLDINANPNDLYINSSKQITIYGNLGYNGLDYYPYILVLDSAGNFVSGKQDYPRRKSGSSPFAVDSSNNVYYSDSTYNYLNPLGPSKVVVNKFNSSNAFQSGIIFDSINSISPSLGTSSTTLVDGIYVWMVVSGYGSYAYIIKMPISLASVTSARYDGAFSYSRGIVANNYNSSAGVLYAFSEYTNYYGTTVLINDTNSWKKRIFGNSESGDAGTLGIVTASSGNIYWLIHDYGGEGVVLIKFNSSGTLQWKKIISIIAYGGSDVSGQLTLDSSENVYVSITDVYSVYDDKKISITKIGQSGGIPFIQWSRDLFAGEIMQQTIRIDADDPYHYYILGYTFTGQNQFVIQLPVTGAKTESFTINGLSVTYAVGSTTLSDSSMPIYNVTDTLTSVSTSTSSYTPSFSSATYTVTEQKL